MNLPRLLRNPGIQTVLIVLFMLGALQLWFVWQAPGKIDARIPPALEQNGRANVIVELNFAPERYHIIALQNFGRVGGAEGNQVQVRNITPEGIESLARTYWVKSITLLENP